MASGRGVAFAERGEEGLSGQCPSDLIPNQCYKYLKVQQVCSGRVHSAPPAKGLSSERARCSMHDG